MRTAAITCSTGLMHPRRPAVIALAHDLKTLISFILRLAKNHHRH